MSRLGGEFCDSEARGNLWRRLDKGGFPFRAKGFGAFAIGAPQAMVEFNDRRERERERERVAETGAVGVGDTLFIVCFDLADQCQAWGAVMTSTLHYVLIRLLGAYMEMFASPRKVSLIVC